MVLARRGRLLPRRGRLLPRRGRLLPSGCVSGPFWSGAVPEEYYPHPQTARFLAGEQNPSRAVQDAARMVRAV
nr:1-acyl-sn-glycerol-3-phosphate acyltransferase (EC [Desulfovibrio diazotrophicus]